MEPRVWHRRLRFPTCRRRIVYESLTLPQMSRASRQSGTAAHPAILFHNCRMTYGDLKNAVDTFCHRLGGHSACGPARGSRIHATQHPSGGDRVLRDAYSSAPNAVLTNPLYVPREIEYQWKGLGLSRGRGDGTSSSRRRSRRSAERRPPPPGRALRRRVDPRVSARFRCAGSPRPQTQTREASGHRPRGRAEPGCTFSVS